MEEMYGEYYTINGCDTYPMDVKKLVALLDPILKKCDSYKAQFFQVGYEEFTYEGAMEDSYTTYAATENLMDYVFNNVFYDISFKLEDGCWLRVVHEYLDERCYSICMLFSEEQLEANFTEEERIVYLQEMKELFYTTLDPIYGTMGMEAAVDSIYAKEKFIIGEKLYIKNDSDIALIRELEKNSRGKMKPIKLENGYIIPMEGEV